MVQHQLTRQERGKLAEQLVRGLHSDPEEAVTDEIEEHTQKEYEDLIGNWPVSVEVANINGYVWKDQLKVPIPEEISWRPDIIIRATWRRYFPKSQLPVGDFWKHTPPFSMISTVSPDPFGHRREPHLRSTFTVYYPVEVKSGQKPTLTGQQQAALPQVVSDVEYVHPVIATVDIADLPEEYTIRAKMFESSDWADGNSRYPSTE